MPTVPLSAGVVSRYQVAQPIQVGVKTSFTETDRLSAFVEAQATEAQLRRAGVEMGFTEAIRASTGLSARFQYAAQLPAITTSHRFQDGLRDRRQLLEGRMQEARQLGAAAVRQIFQDGLRDRLLSMVATFQDALPVRKGWLVSSQEAARSGAWRAARFQEAWAVRAGVSPPLEPPDIPVDPDPDDPLYIIPLLRVYMSVHLLNCVLLPSGESVTLRDATLSEDDDGFGWSIAASGPEHLLEQLAPSGGMPAQIKITIDGIDWVFVVQSVARTRRAGERRAQITGSSVTALLGEPYQAVQSFLGTSDRTAQQIVAAALEFTGVDVNWGMPDWFVPAAAWSHQGTPLSAALRVAEAVRGVVRSHKTDPLLYFTPRYPVLPWDWSTSTPDVEMPLAVVTIDSYQPVYKPSWNGVYVGGESVGVFGRVRRTGSAGDVLAAQVTDALITHVDAARQRGNAELGAGGPQVTQALTVPVLTGGTMPGVLKGGQLIKVVEPAVTWYGQVRGVTVNASLPAVRQTIVVERHL